RNVVIYVDLNDNGVRDNYNGQPEPAGTTDDAGNYWIVNIPPGQRRVREIVPVGYTQSYPHDAPYHIVDLSPGEELLGVDFANKLSDPIPGSGSVVAQAGVIPGPNGDRTTDDSLTAVFTGLGSISGQKWEDTDGDGSHDANERGLAGVTIYVDLNGNGQLDLGQLLGDYNDNGVVDAADYVVWRKT